MVDQLTEPLSGAPIAAPPAPVLPTAADFFGQKPTAGEFFGPPPVNTNALALGGADMDEYFSQGSAGRILDLFGHGASQGWGTEPLDIGPETQKKLREAGIFNDYEKGQNSLVREFNERLLRGAAIGANAIMRAPGAVLHGLYETEPTIGGPLLAGAEAFPLGHVTGFPTRVAPAALERARDLGVIGRGEAGFRDGVDTTTEAERALRPTGVESPTEQVVTRPEPEAVPPAPEVAPIATEAPPAAVPLDVHGTARQVAPDTFAEYDALSARKETFRRWLDELAATRAADPRVEAMQGRIDSILGRVAGNEDRLTKAQTGRLEAARRDLADFLRAETPDMARVRADLQSTDVRMRDLAPDVSAAYREARGLVPEEAAIPAAAEAPLVATGAPAVAEAVPPVTAAPEVVPVDPAAPQPVPAAVETPPAPVPTATEPVVAPPRPSAAPPARALPAGGIAEDVAQNLTTAGRPAPEAEAAGALVQAHYTARAERFGGARGTPEDLYLAEAPAVRAGRGVRALEMAQKGETPAVELDQVKRGKIRLATEQARGTITLFKDADASTFIHETGHHWLEELITDAADERAPADLRADAETVRTWLGTKEGEAIPTRAHEKFARGFERYMMEGHAPTSALADVFAKFRDWLMRIYQTVDNLRSPINDEIRGVFDRLLATKDEGAVVAPDREAAGAETNPREMVGSPSARPGAFGAFERVPAEPLRLVDFLKKNGGLRDDTFSRRVNTSRGREDARANPTDIRSIAGDHPRAKGLIRARTGMAHDAAALKAWEAGYFPEHTGSARPTVNDLYNAIGEDLNGAPSRYAAGDAQAVQDYHDALNRNAEIDRLANALGINARDYTPEQFFDLAAEQMSREAQAREIGSQEAATELTFDEAERKAQETIESRGDAWEPDAENATTAPRSLEDLERAHEQEREAAANARKGGSPPGEVPGSAAGDQGALQEGDGSRGRGAGIAGRTGPSAGETPAGPHATFAPHDDRLVDKAGNIRLDNLNQPEDINVAIRDAAEKNDDFIGARRGVISDGQVLDLADALGMDAGTLSQRKLGQAFNAEEIVAARKLLIQSATTVRDAMAKAAAGDDAAVLAYAEAKARHMMIQEQVAGLTAEAGRALRAFRSLAGMKEAVDLGSFIEQTTGRSLNQLRREAQLGMDLDTPQKLSKFINDSRRATFKDMLLEFWINALLSGPVTHIKNIVGNTAVAVNSVLETGGGAAIGTIRHALTGAEDYATFGEAKARLFGLVQGAQEGVVAAAKAFKNEESFTGTQTIEQRRFQSIPSVTVKIGERDVEIGGKQVRLPGRLLTAEDEFFKAIAVRQELNAMGWREAARAGLEGDAFNAKVAEIVTNPTDAQMLAAKQNADYQTFTRPLGATGRAIQNFANSHILAKIVVPFIRTPVNLLKYAQERSPLGVFSQEVRNNLAAGGITRDTQIARMTMGTMVSVAAAGLWMQGLITDGGPSDPKERAAKMLTGWRPYSVKIGEMYYAYDWLDPFSTGIGIAADLAAAAVHLSDTDADIAKIGAGLIGGLSKNIMQKASLRGASDLIVALTDPTRYGPHYVQGLLGSLVPSVVARAAASQDPLQREARTTLDAVKARLPGLREGLFPRRDVWGEPMENQGALGPDMLSPIRQAAMNTDPVNQALLRARYFPAKMENKIRGVELTDQQYDDFARIGGRFAKIRLDGIVANPGFAQLPVVTQHEMIRSAVMHAHEAARSLVMMQSVGTDNDIVKKATEAKVKALREPAPAP